MGAKAPIAPILTRRSLGKLRASPLSTLLAGDNILLVTSGRSALALALSELNIVTDDEILVPAYHCVAMTGPIHASGGKPVFYRLHDDLTIDMSDLTSKISSRTRSVIVVHFFGFPQSLDALQDTCRRASLSLIEDCAHAFYGSASPQSIGRRGDFAIGSLMKFFPVFDGGCLVANRRALGIHHLRSGGLRFQLKSLLDTVERAAQWSNASSMRLLRRAIERVRSLRHRTATGADRSHEYSPGSALGGIDFESAWTNVRMSMVSRFILRFSNHQRSIARRREIYAQYLAALSGLQGGHPLYGPLPADTVPYVFPFVLSDPDKTFMVLRNQGVPIYRWEDVCAEACPTAKKYKDRLVQFPCHQELSSSHVTWVIETIQKVLAGRAT